MADIHKVVVALEAESSKLRSELKKTQARMARWEKGVTRSVKRTAATFKSSFGGLAALFSADLFIGVQRQTAVLRTQLETATGSIDAMNEQWSTLEEFAKTTPFSLKEAVDGFVRLKNLGLDPSIDALRSYANTAAAMGTSLQQFIEAVADASVGEFERLKEFGIKASKQGDTIRFLFKGITTEVNNSAKDITKFLQRIGNVDFAGATEKRAKTLDGALSNLSESFAALVRSIGDLGLTSAIQALAEGFGGLATVITKAANAAKEFFNQTDQERFTQLQEQRLSLLKQIDNLQNLSYAKTRRVQKMGQLVELEIELGRLSAQLNKRTNDAIEQQRKLNAEKTKGNQITEDGLKALQKQGESFKNLVEEARKVIQGDQSNPLTKGTLNEVLRSLEKAKTLESAGDTKGAFDAATKTVEQLKALSEAGKISKQFATSLLEQASALGAAASDRMIELKLDDETLKAEAERARKLIQDNFSAKPFDVALAWSSPDTPANLPADFTPTSPQAGMAPIILNFPGGSSKVEATPDEAQKLLSLFEQANLEQGCRA